MRPAVAVENIEEMRCQVGINDVELRKAIRGLRAGDFVRLTLLTGPPPCAAETLLVRITRVRGRAFRGKLASRPVSARLARLRAGWPVAFTSDHIHSIPGGRADHER
jgi:hypothetical protein